jgi:hypothetical protein
VDDDDSLANCYFADTRWGREPEAPGTGALICECPGLSGVYLRPSDLRFEDSGLVPASALRGRFWWTRSGLDRKYPDAAPTSGTYDEVLTTEEIFAAIASGFDGFLARRLRDIAGSPCRSNNDTFRPTISENLSGGCRFLSEKRLQAISTCDLGTECSLDQPNQGILDQKIFAPACTRLPPHDGMRQAQ